MGTLKLRAFVSSINQFHITIKKTSQKTNSANNEMLVFFCMVEL